MMTAEQWRKRYPDQNQRRQFARISPLAWILEYQPKIIKPGVGRVVYEPYWFQQDLLNCEDSFRVIEKSRQIGISTTEAFEAAWELLNVPAARLIVISKGYEEVKEFMEYVKVALQSIEDSYPDFPAYGKNNEDEITFPSLDSRIKALPASETAGRSFASSHFRFDETAHTKFARKIFKAASPGLSTTGGRITVFTSPEPGTFFSDLTEHADDMGATLFTFPWWYSPAFNPVFDQWYLAYLSGNSKRAAELVEEAKQGDWYKSERPKHSKLEWEQEFECRRDSNEMSVYSAWQLKNNFRRTWLDEIPAQIGELWVDPDLDKYIEAGNWFATGVDLGRKNDATVAVTFDYTQKPAKVVAYRRIPGGHGASWAYILAEIRALHSRFQRGTQNSNHLIHDATAMGGDVISEALEDISEPFQFQSNQQNRAKHNLIERSRKAFDERAVLLPRIPSLLREFRGYKWVDKGLSTDAVMAVLMALFVFYQGDSGKVQVVSDFSFVQ